MADNLDDSTSDNPPNIQPENYTSETTSATANTNNSNLHRKPKKWNAYYLQFIMIFLAVTLGFFAENFRQHIANRTKEKQSLLSDKNR